MCHRNIKKVGVMIIKSSISFFRKVFESNMYFIRTETGTIVFEPPASSDDSSVTDTGKE